MKTLTVKIDDTTNTKLSNYANDSKQTKSMILRDALDSYMQQKAKPVGESLRTIAENAKQYDYQAPEDIMSNMNQYLYEKPE